MKEAEWLASWDWLALWHYALDKEHLSDRKRRLLAVAACRTVGEYISDPRLLRMMEFAEVWADSQPVAKEVDWWEEAEDRYAEAEAAATEEREPPFGPVQQAAAWAAAMLGNDDSKVGRSVESVASVFGFLALIRKRWMTEAGDTVPGVTMWDHPDFIAGQNDGGGRAICPLIRELVGNPFRPVAFDPSWRTSTAVQLARRMYDARDFGPMPILADALQEAGCEHSDVLAHCRGDGPHVRGCWVVDLVLGNA